MVVLDDGVTNYLVESYAGLLKRVAKFTYLGEGKSTTPKRLTIGRRQRIFKVLGKQEIGEGFGIIQLITSDKV